MIDIDKIGQYAGAIFDSMRQYADYDFIFKNPLYRQLITHIPTKKYNWLDFNMGFEDKLGLFMEGVVAGYVFLESFDWAQHKKLRATEFEKYKDLHGIPPTRREKRNNYVLHETG